MIFTTTSHNVPRNDRKDTKTRRTHATKPQRHTFIIDGQPVVTLPLSGKPANGRRLLLDKQDYEMLRDRYANPWRVETIGNAEHVVGSPQLSQSWFETAPRVQLKRLLMGATTGESVHVLNGNPCDLRRCNLEVRPKRVTNHPTPCMIHNANDRNAALVAALCGQALLIENVTVEKLDALPWSHIGTYPGGAYDGLSQDEVTTALKDIQTTLPVPVKVSLHVSWDRKSGFATVDRIHARMPREVFGIVTLAITPQAENGLPNYILDRTTKEFAAYITNDDGKLHNSGGIITDGQSYSVGAALRAVGRDMLRRVNAALNEDEHMRKLNAFASQEASNV